MHLDIILLVVLAALAVWTEVDKLRSRRMPAGNNVRFTFAASGAIQRRLLAGEKADVVLLPVPLLNNLTSTIYTRPGSRALLARVGIASEGRKRKQETGRPL